MKPIAISRLTICGIDELPTHRSHGVTHVLSVLDPEREDPTIFANFDPHERTILRFHDVIEDKEGRPAPTKTDVEAILAYGETLIGSRADRRDGHLLVHCHMGVSRSTAAMITLMAQCEPDRDEDSIFTTIREMRPIAWPNSVMIAFADELLGREGRLTAALHRHYAIQLERDAMFERWMTELERQREVGFGKGLQKT
ncbi:MAG: protein-tyrosine-phosphatase [Thalassospira sp.]|uniref:tyrosine phosphatase family protein n=1 Tax=Thalassospira sp. UBA4513 TaxID=1947675 RepID=UPI000C5A603F|nr:protein-tyrosine-phosphatase [Thalassospira sp. UBA4513]MBE71846.1 protein-tyrosine-phosphatase [Thalassospira sp.]|tara:strand:+ start:183 stop:776 length:594 start_codon:yes stop_codon:yes gene_type:complete